MPGEDVDTVDPLGFRAEVPHHGPVAPTNIVTKPDQTAKIRRADGARRFGLDRNQLLAAFNHKIDLDPVFGSEGRDPDGLIEGGRAMDDLAVDQVFEQPTDPVGRGDEVTDLDKMPSGDYRIQNKKVTPPPRARIDESMEALIHHFKIFTEGFKVPEGEAYCAVESPRGELGCYIVSDGSSHPYRMHVRGPSFVNLQVLPHMMHGGLIADGVAVISSVDPIMGEVDR